MSDWVPMAPEPESAGRRRPSKPVLIGAAAVIVVAVVLAIVLPLTLGGSSAPDSPRAAAQAWGNAVLRHDSSQARALSCSSDPTNYGVLSIALHGSRMRAGRATPSGPNTWTVPLTTEGPGGGTTVTVTVKRKHGDYLIC